MDNPNILSKNPARTYSSQDEQLVRAQNGIIINPAKIHATWVFRGVESISGTFKAVARLTRPET